MGGPGGKRDMAGSGKRRAVGISLSFPAGDRPLLGRFPAKQTAMKLNELTDDELLERTKILASQERNITVEVIRHLREIEARGLHFDRGFPSLYEYAVKELRLSEGSAYRRIQAMRLMKEVPEIEEKLQSGALSLNTAAKVQSAGRKDPELDKQSLLGKLEGKSSREVERELAAGPMKPTESARWVTEGTVELKLFLGKPSFENLEELRAIKSHAPSHSTYSGLVTELIDLGQNKWNPMRRAAPPPRGSSAQTPTGRQIPSALRSEIWKRDQARCSYTDPATGQRCNSRHYLQIDHILPVALGGKSTADNLRLLCAQHNRHRARKTFSPRLN
jgi:hypothetical protein